ncbi:HNH endonuclease family protein [Amnibacterium sp.]|uniref:HNH endonuclease family protein n=1 Tax=Amnibacterium sp. TaxID=1872496 RepID=UPI003F7C100B
MPSRARRSALVAAPLVLVVLIAAAVLASIAARGGAWGSPSATTAPKGSSALAVLATLQVKGRAPMTGYVRTERFGAAWLDVDRNGCDTRDDVLRRDLVDVTGTRCTVRSGVLHDPYTGSTIRFTRGARTSSAVQIDHVVPLGDAWQTGAQGWTQAKRIELANDPVELLAVDGPTNEQKGDGDAATWLPPNKAFRCSYVARQIGVKHAYGLWVTPAEKAAMEQVLRSCPDVRAPVSTLVHAGAVAAAPSSDAPAATSSSTSASPSSSAAPSGGSVVRAGSYCSPSGATARTASGTRVVCRSTASDPRTRWRSPA